MVSVCAGVVRGAPATVSRGRRRSSGEGGAARSDRGGSLGHVEADGAFLLGRERPEHRPPRRGGGHGASSGDGRVLCRGGAPGSNGGFVELPGKVWKLARACARVEEGREQGLHGEVFAAARAAAAGFWAGRRGALGSGHGLGQRGRKGRGQGWVRL